MMFTAKRFVEIPEVNHYLSQVITKPRSINDKTIVVKSKSNPQIVGTAVDFAIKIFLAEKFNLNFPDRECFVHKEFNLEGLGPTDCKKILRKLNKDFDTGMIEESNLVEASLIFALNDSFCKSGVLPSQHWNTYSDLQDEVAELLSHAKFNTSTFKNVIISPSLTGVLPGLVAEADIICDGTLIDIKTVSSPGIKKSEFNRLVLYFILCKKHPELCTLVNRIGIYFARQSSFEFFNLNDVLLREGVDDIYSKLQNFIHQD